MAAITLITPPLLPSIVLLPIPPHLRLQEFPIHPALPTRTRHAEVIPALKHPAPPLDLAKDAIVVVAFGPVEHAVLVRGGDAAAGDLEDVDVDWLVLLVIIWCRGGWGGGGGGGVLAGRGGWFRTRVLVHGQCDGGEGDGFAEEPGEALEG